MLLLLFMAMLPVVITSIVMRGVIVLVVGVGVVVTLLAVLVPVVSRMLLLEWMVTLETVVVLLFVVRAWPVKKLMVAFMPLAVIMVLLTMLRDIVMRRVFRVIENFFSIVWLLP